MYKFGASWYSWYCHQCGKSEVIHRCLIIHWNHCILQLRSHGQNCHRNHPRGHPARLHSGPRLEFIATFLFVFAGVGSAMAADKLGGDALVGLFVVAVAHALVVAVMISAAHSSGGHLNPAVTLGLLVGGHITVVRSIIYWIDQLVLSAAAFSLLHYLSGGLVTPVHTPASGVGYGQGVVWEIVLTFSLLFCVYATMVDLKKGALARIGPTLVGFVVGANILAGGPLSAASVNPARSFGPAMVTGNWTDHWVYWVGPLIGGGLAGFIYESFFINRAHVPLPTDEESY